jgi:hypothetical protein
VGIYGLDVSGLAFCEHDNKPSGSIKVGNFMRSNC